MRDRFVGVYSCNRHAFCPIPLTTLCDMRQDTVPTRENVRGIFDKVGFVPLDIHQSHPKRKPQILTLMLALTLTSLYLNFTVPTQPPTARSIPATPTL